MRKYLILLCSFVVLPAYACDDDDDANGGGDAGDVADAGGDTASDTSDTGGDVAPDSSAETGDDAVDDTADADPDGEIEVGDDTSPDADTSECVQAQIVPSWGLEVADDTSVGFNVVITPQVDEFSDLIFLFDRYMDVEYEGTFTLGQGEDANFGTCAHCVALWDYGSTAYFADEGTLTINRDPYSRRFDASVTNLRLIEVTVDGETRESTPVPNGDCVEVANFTVSEAFPDEGWTCFDDQFSDGVECDCECGAIDPDCQHDVCLPGDPECEENRLPVADCAENEVCTFDPSTFPGTTVCAESCGWEARDGCTEGVCVFDFGVGDGDLCFTDETRFDDAVIGEDCEPFGLQTFCNVSEGFALGFCDWNGRCSPICDAQEDCPVEGESCIFFAGEGGLGWCGTPFEDG